MRTHRRVPRKLTADTNWDAVADRYDGWIGAHGSKHHRELAIPALLELLTPQRNEHILDIGAGQGVLAPYIVQRGARYTGVDASEKLLRLARRRHRGHGAFLRGDARRLAATPGLRPALFDGVTFLLSIQDMDPLDMILRSAAWALRPGGRIVLLMNHPCFRVPRQSGWGWDARRKLRYRRIDRYLTALPVPVAAQHRQGDGITRSFHRPLEAYINELGACGLLLDRIKEISAFPAYASAAGSTAENSANQEIPLFLALRAWKVAG